MKRGVCFVLCLVILGSLSGFVSAAPWSPFDGGNEGGGVYCTGGGETEAGKDCGEFFGSRGDGCGCNPDTNTVWCCRDRSVDRTICDMGVQTHSWLNYEVSCPNLCVDNDGDGYGSGCALGPDCNDDNDKVYPGAVEICDQLDNDCDSNGNVDEQGVCGPGDSCTKDGQCESGICNKATLTCGGGGGPGDPCSRDKECLNGICNVETNRCEGLLSDSFWSNVLGERISGADVGDRVLMNVAGTDLEDSNVGFEIFKENPIWFDSSVFSGDSGSVSWVISEGGTFYFEATLEGGEKIRSNDLEVLNARDNSPPVVVIASPEDGGIYFANQDIAFTHLSYDVDDEIASDVWDLGDGNTIEGGRNLYSYSESGKKTITLTVTDERGLSTSEEISILVIDDDPAEGSRLEIYADIKNPGEGDIFEEDGNGALKVDYDGSGSYALEVLADGSCVSEVICLGGSCPTTTGNVPSCAGGVGMSVDGTLSGSFVDLDFEWDFVDEGQTAIGVTTGSYTYAFSGEKEIIMDLGYDKDGLSGSGQDEVNFYVLDGDRCVERDDGISWFEVFSDGVVVEHDAFTMCEGVDGASGTGDDCCPSGYACVDGACALDASVPLRCGDYEDYDSYKNLFGSEEDIDDAQEACEDDPFDAWKVDPARDGLQTDCGDVNFDGELVGCRCVWFDDGGNESCFFNVSFSRFSSGGGGIERPPASECVIDSVEGECVNGFQTFEYRVLSGNDCDLEPSVTVPCGKPSIELPFFGMVQGILVLGIIALGYLVLGIRRKD